MITASFLKSSEIAFKVVDRYFYTDDIISELMLDHIGVVCAS